MPFFEESARLERGLALWGVLLALSVLATVFLVPLLFVLLLGLFLSTIGSADLLEELIAGGLVPYAVLVVLLLVLVGLLAKLGQAMVPLAQRWESLGFRPAALDDPALPAPLRNVAAEMQLAAQCSVRLYAEVLPLTDARHLRVYSDGQVALVRLTQGMLDDFSRDALQAALAHAVARASERRDLSERVLVSAVHGLDLLYAMGGALVVGAGWLVAGALKFAAMGQVRDGLTAVLFFIRLYIACLILGFASVCFLAGLSLVIGSAITHTVGRFVLRKLNRGRVLRADAKAVQFTRLDAGLREALEKACAPARSSTGVREVWRDLWDDDMMAFVGPQQIGWRQAFVRVHPTREERMTRVAGGQQRP